MARLLLIMFARINRIYLFTLIRADVDLSSRQQELLEPTWKKRLLFEKMATDQNDHKIGKFQSHIRILVPSNSTVLDYHHFIPSKIIEAYHGVLQVSDLHLIVCGDALKGQSIWKENKLKTQLDQEKLLLFKSNIRTLINFTRFSEDRRVKTHHDIANYKYKKFTNLRLM